MATCPGPMCPMCTGTVCAACDSAGVYRTNAPADRCTHAVDERHQSRILIPEVSELPSQDRTPTRPEARILARQVCIGIGDVPGAVRLLKLAIEIIEKHGEICVTLEAPAPKKIDG